MEWTTRTSDKEMKANPELGVYQKLVSSRSAIIRWSTTTNLLRAPLISRYIPDVRYLEFQRLDLARKRTGRSRNPRRFAVERLSTP